jgi:peptidoglycan/LPS O-acetylase OafA/YrhL
MEQIAADMGSGKSPQVAKAYRADIDGLRGIAVLAVVLVHAGVPWLKGGFVGVDIFFVISGYLIGAHVYSDTSRGCFSLADFYRKRAKRILPALLALLVVCYGLAMLLLSPVDLLNYARYSIATILSVSNIRAWKQIGYFAPDANQNSLLMTWSLGVEEQFYLFFPLIMLGLGKRPFRVVFTFVSVLAATSLIFCIIVSRSRPRRHFFCFHFGHGNYCLGCSSRFTSTFAKHTQIRFVAG